MNYIDIVNMLYKVPPERKIIALLRYIELPGYGEIILIIIGITILINQRKIKKQLRQLLENKDKPN